jgi:hypothetical protein
MTTATDQYFDLKSLSAYSCLGVGTLRDYMREGLPYFKLKGKILVKRSEFDEWMQCYRVDRNQELNKIVEDVIKGLSDA